MDQPAPAAEAVTVTIVHTSACFFALGMFSGVASSCCAPVLAGVMTLSALSGSPAGGVLLGVAYVFGMTFPLFVMALAWDRFGLGERRWLRARPVRIRLAGRTLVTNTVNAAVAAAFAVMGGFVLYLANTGRMTSGPDFQVAIGRFLTRVFARVEAWTAGVPELLLGAVVLALAAGFIAAALRGRRHHTAPAGTESDTGTGTDTGNGTSDGPRGDDATACHHTQTTR